MRVLQCPEDCHRTWAGAANGNNWVESLELWRPNFLLTNGLQRTPQSGNLSDEGLLQESKRPLPARPCRCKTTSRCGCQFADGYELLQIIALKLCTWILQAAQAARKRAPNFGMCWSACILSMSIVLLVTYVPYPSRIVDVPYIVSSSFLYMYISAHTYIHIHRYTHVLNIRMPLCAYTHVHIL